jgi:hypothetical protein
VSYTRLAGEWAELLGRRASFRDVLSPYGGILEAWAGWTGGIAPLAWSAEACRAVWERGAPLLAEAPPEVPREALEELLGPTLDFLAAVGDEPEALRRFAAAWDGGELSPRLLLPVQGRLGSPAVQSAVGLSQEALGFLVYGSLRPILEVYLARCREHVGGQAWDLGLCPLCGAPPGFGDIGDDGKRRLVCHVCGGSWGFSRLTCPYCGSRNPQDAVRLQAEEAEEGYVVAACQGCRGYLKEIDRRARWNAVSPLLEDWSTPHLDLVARRAEYWRAVPTLLDLQREPEPD